MKKSDATLMLAEALVNAGTVATKLSMLTNYQHCFSTKQAANFLDWLTEMLTDEEEETSDVPE